MNQPAVRARLLSAFARPSDIVVASALSCASPRLVTADELGADPAAEATTVGAPGSTS